MTAETVMDSVSQAARPGAWLVDYLPICESHAVEQTRPIFTLSESEESSILGSLCQISASCKLLGGERSKSQICTLPGM